MQEIPAPTAKKGKEEGKQAKGQAAEAPGSELSKEVLKQLQELSLFKYKCQQLEKQLLAETRQKDDLDKVARAANSKVERLKEQLEGSRGEVAVFRAGTKEVKERTTLLHWRHCSRVSPP